MSWLKQLGDQTSKLTDIFNLGRLIFYTAAGALVAYPVAASVRALAGPFRGDPIGELVCAGQDLNHEEMIFAAIVVGFIVAGYGFVRVVEPAGPAVRVSAESSPVDRRSYPFCYPMLRNADGDGYHDWLVREYFRFVEIVAYVPLGFLGGLAASTLYAGTYVLIWTAGGHGVRFAAPHATFVALAAIYAVCAFFVWPRFWVPGVVRPVIHVHHRAKLALVIALEERNRERAGSLNAPAQPSEKASAKPAPKKTSSDGDNP